MGPKRAAKIRRLAFPTKESAHPNNKKYYRKNKPTGFLNRTGDQLYADENRRYYQFLKGRRTTEKGL